MPFTLSHPAAAVPFSRWGLVLSALIVGSLSPDFIYFIFLSPQYHAGHTFIGLFILDIPMGLVVLWIFHKILKYPILSLFPITHQHCLMPVANRFHFFPLPHFLLIVFSLFIGALTHIAWDAVTHFNGWVVVQLPILSAPLIETAQGTLKVYKVLQYGSTFLGAALLFYGYISGLKQTPKPPIRQKLLLSTQTQWFILVLMGLSSGFVAMIYGFVSVAPLTHFRLVYPFIVQTVVAGISLLFIELIIFSILWHWQNPNPNPQPPLPNLIFTHKK
ncbi:MAG TPA: DUF4184 family protein [Thiotrichaceae bacterium]|nr:DUF4184 family protein [Thiotrichaceae bacterium]